MNQGKDYPRWFLWMYEKGPILFFVIVGLIVVMFGAITWYLDQRLDEVQQRINFVPPTSYEAPDFNNYPAGDVQAENLPVRQLVYVPIYSHAYYQGGAPYLLESTLSIRNVDPKTPIYLSYVKYYGTTGELAKTYLDQLIKLEPLQTIEFLVERRDSSGGSGANFLVEWRSEPDANRPLVEAVMIGTAGTQGISFGRTGVEISEK